MLQTLSVLCYSNTNRSPLYPHHSTCKDTGTQTFALVSLNNGFACCSNSLSNEASRFFWVISYYISTIYILIHLFHCGVWLAYQEVHAKTHILFRTHTLTNNINIVYITVLCGRRLAITVLGVETL